MLFFITTTLSHQPLNRLCRALVLDRRLIARISGKVDEAHWTIAIRADFFKMNKAYNSKADESTIRPTGPRCEIQK